MTEDQRSALIALLWIAVIGSGVIATYGFLLVNRQQCVGYRLASGLSLERAKEACE